MSGHETRSNRWIFLFLFLKKCQELCLISIQYLFGFFILEKFRTGVSCFSITLLYFTLLALTDRQNDGQTCRVPPGTQRNTSNSYGILQKSLKILRNDSLWVCGVFWKTFFYSMSFSWPLQTDRICLTDTSVFFNNS